MSAEIYKKIGRNSFYNIARRAVLLPLNLVLVAVTLRYIGVEQYGVWVFVQTVMTFATLMDFGISSGITKYTAEYDASGNHAKILQVFNTFFVIYLLCSTVFIVLVFLYQDWIIANFAKTEQLSHADIAFILLTSAFVFALNMAFSVYPSFLNGLQRMDLTNKAAAVLGAANFAFSILFLMLGWKIKALVAANAAASVITLFVHICYTSRAAPYLKLNPLLFDFGTLLHVFKFSSYGAIGGILALLHFQLDKLIVNYFLGVSFLAFYDVAHKVVFLLWSVCGAFTTAIMPAASSAYANMGLPKVREMFQTIFKYVVFLATPVFLFTSVFAQQIVFVWLGPGFDSGIFVLRFLSLVYLIGVFTGPGASILTGMGLPKIPFYSSLIAAASSTTLSILLVPRMGLAGSMISAFTAYILGGFYGFYNFRKVLEIPTVYFLDCLRFPLLTSIVTLVILRFAVLPVQNDLVGLVLGGLVFSVVYAVLACRNCNYKLIKDLVFKPASILSLLGLS